MLGCATLAFTWTVDVAAQAADMPPLAFRPLRGSGILRLDRVLRRRPSRRRLGKLALGGEQPWGAHDRRLAQPVSAVRSFRRDRKLLRGIQAGYNYMLPNRLVVGAEVDASFPAFPNLSGISIGGSSTFLSPSLGAESFGETVLSFGTARGRIGYAPGDWLLYATGGFAWTYDR